jgi:GNAT superfamily N-acetyltransferase
MREADRGCDFVVRRLDIAAYPSDVASYRNMLAVNCGFFPCDTYHKTMHPTNCAVLLAVRRDELETAVGCLGMVFFDHAGTQRAHITWLSVELRQRGLGLARRLAHDAVCLAVKRAVIAIDALKTPDSGPFWRHLGWSSSEGIVLRHSMSRPLVGQAAHHKLTAEALCVRDRTVRFRPAVADDRKAWQTLVLDGCQYNLGGSEMVAETIAAEFRVVAVDAENLSDIVGLISFTENGWLSFLVTRCDFRRQGVATTLLCLALEWLRLGGGTSSQLTPLSRPVMSFYTALGYKLRPAPKKKPFGANQEIMTREVVSTLPLTPAGFTTANLVEGDVVARAQSLPPRGLEVSPNTGCKPVAADSLKQAAQNLHLHNSQAAKKSSKRERGARH